MRVYHFLFSAIAVILSLSMIISCNKQEEPQKPDPKPDPTPKEAVVIDKGLIQNQPSSRKVGKPRSLSLQQKTGASPPGRINSG